MSRLRRKVISVILSLVLLFSLMPVRPAQAAEPVVYVTREQALAALQSIVGEGALAADNTPEPRQYITRLEFAEIVSNLLRELPSIFPNGNFGDVPAEKTEEINELVRAGLFVGYGSGRFGADDYLTQSQLSAVLSRIKGLADIRPQDDFYYYVNRHWIDFVELPAGYPGLTAFDEVRLRNNEKLKELVRKIVSNSSAWQEGTKEQKIADFYSTIMDVENRNKEGIEPIRQYLERLARANSIQELLDMAAQMENEAGLNPLFTFSPSVDLQDSNRYSLYASGLSTVLPVEYLLMDNPQIKELYLNFIKQMFIFADSAPEAAQEKAQQIYALEKTIAEHTLSREEASKIENVYNPRTVSEITGMFPGVNLKKYLTDLGYGQVEKVIVTDTGLLKKTGELFSAGNLDVLKSFAIYNLITGTAPYLSKNMEQAVTAFNNAFLGVSSSMSEEENAFNLLNNVTGWYLGQMYVENYFSAEAKHDVEDIVKEIIATYEKRIRQLDWMTEATKEAAIAKLRAIKMKIGYPDIWNDPLQGINFKTYAEGGSLLGNILAITSAQVKYVKTLLDKPVDKSEWLITPQTVNAYYNATSNEIVFPAGILQAPFYDVNASREQNLGGIGSVIAHEITHAFDNNGAQFDKNGNLQNWWQESDYLIFQQKCQEVVRLYNGLDIAPGAVVNGNLTVSENVADIGAMACILDIAAGMPNANYKELFESNARIWRMTATNQMYQLLATQDVHAPNKFRVNQVVRNFQVFYDTYNIGPDDPMYLAPDQRVVIW